jgi:hypothetical protein
MTYLQSYLILTVVFFVSLGVMLNANNMVGQLLKIGCWLMAIFGTVVTLASLNIVLANGIKLI